MSTFLDLPDELILKILSYTETADIFRCGRVSNRRIKTISNDDSLFQRVNLGGRCLKAKFLETASNNGCKSLNLSGSSIWGNLNLTLESQLRELDLSNCKLTRYEVFEELLASCHFLQTLSLEGLKMTPKILASICKNRQTLQVLNLYDVFLETKCYQEIIKACQKIKLFVIDGHTKLTLSLNGLLSITNRTLVTQGMMQSRSIHEI